MTQFNRKTRRAVAALSKGPKKGVVRPLPVVGQEYRALAAAAGSLETRIHVGDRELVRLKTRLERLDRKRKGSWFLRLFTTLQKLEGKYYALSTRIGDLSAQVRRDREELRKLHVKIDATNREGEAARD